MKQLGGYIWVYSEIGLGTAFELYFPQAPAGTSPHAEAGTPFSVGPPLGKEVILLVEDEPGVRKLAAAVLKRHGYTVLEASGAAEALTLSHALPSRIHLLLTDVMMANMNGAALACEIRRSRADISVLFMSGYTAEALTRNGTLDDGVELLNKPFSARTLLDRVRVLLDRDGARQRE